MKAGKFENLETHKTKELFKGNFYYYYYTGTWRKAKKVEELRTFFFLI